MEKVTIFCENTGKYYKIEIGSYLGDLKKIVFPNNHKHLLGALVNNQLQDLQYVIMNPMQINFIDITTLDGYSIYTRSLIFVLYKAIRSLFPKKTLMAEYIISNGIFCRIANKDVCLRPDMIENIHQKMQEIIQADYPIVRKEIPTPEAIRIFRKQGLKDKSSSWKPGEGFILPYIIFRTQLIIFTAHWLLLPAACSLLA